MQGEKSAFIFIFEPYVEIQNVFGFSIVADPILKKDSFFLSIIIYAENKSPNLLSTILIPPYSTVELKQEILQQCLGKKIWDSVFLECAGSNENNVLGFPIDFDYIKEEVLQKSP
ncbi:hypothetical protein ADICYQ_3911 [Cyclobacterium qasimii M12-11B]|uniref:Uncharacterized protein n=3 Tax=Cyclobacterium qasimii TaxID=1350429 RepID=S7VAN7_9BACT|nr:hypothetical protein ADICYQ_3911 [Cyclobacterium qasimii M12-11B]GEO19740.1 hypothetical protein CQA01_02740 [Cyclobacterium qasimii]